MLKKKNIIFILLTVILASSEAYCQEGILDKVIQGETKDLQISTITGSITHVSTQSGVISVQTDMGQKVFYISVESNLYRHTHHIASIEIHKGDPVTIQYTISSSGKNIIIKLEDNKSDSGG
jgi:hypothetical protein